MPRGYYGDCRDCIYYANYFHKINHSEYDYRCDHCKEYFNDCYGNTCYMFEGKEDIKQQLAEKRKTKESVLAGGIIINSIINSDVNDNSHQSYENTTSSSQEGFPLGEFIFLAVIGFLFLKVMYIFFIGPIINKLFS